MERYYGFHRGEIASIDDPDERYRYRVRVFDIHDNTIPVEHLPFASAVAFVGEGFGDVPHYEVGDRVLVVFERGMRDHPIIMGSWVTGQRDAANVLTPDFPEDQSDDYETRRKNWDRQDRDGNRVRITEGTTAQDQTSLELHSVNQILIETEQGNLEVNITEDGNIVIQGNLTLNVSGDCDIVADKVSINGATEVEIVSATLVTVNCPDVQLGPSAAEQVVTETRLSTLFNAHTHPETGGTTGTPTAPMTPGSVSSPNVKAS